MPTLLAAPSNTRAEALAYVRAANAAADQPNARHRRRGLVWLGPVRIGVSVVLDHVQVGECELEGLADMRAHGGAGAGRVAPLEGVEDLLVLFASEGKPLAIIGTGEGDENPELDSAITQGYGQRRVAGPGKDGLVEFLVGIGETVDLLAGQVPLAIV